MSIFESLYGASVDNPLDPFDLYTDFSDTDKHFSLDPPTNFNYLSQPETRTSHEPLTNWSAPRLADDYKNESLLLFENDDDLYDLLPNFTDSISSDDIAPDGILRLDYDNNNNNAGHDGVLYLTNDREYVAADSHLTESFVVDQPQLPYVASDSHLTVNETDMDIYNSYGSPQNISGGFNHDMEVHQQSFALPEPPLNEPADLLSTFAGLCKSNDWLFSSQDKTPLNSLKHTAVPFQEQFAGLNLVPKRQTLDTNTRRDRFQSRSEYFTSSLREQQLQRYREKKVRRVYYRSVDVKRSAQAKTRERNARGRFVVCH